MKCYLVFMLQQSQDCIYSCLHFRVHQIFKAKLGLLGEDEDDNDLIAFLLKVIMQFVSVF